MAAVKRWTPGAEALQRWRNWEGAYRLDCESGQRGQESLSSMDTLGTSQLNRKTLILQCLALWIE